MRHFIRSKTDLFNFSFWSRTKALFLCTSVCWLCQALFSLRYFERVLTRTSELCCKVASSKDTERAFVFQVYNDFQAVIKYKPWITTKNIKKNTTKDITGEGTGVFSITIHLFLGKPTPWSFKEGPPRGDQTSQDRHTLSCFILCEPEL